MFTLYTFGDSILDCGGYNALGLTPGGLIVRNDDRAFPEFLGQDLSTLGPARLVERARDGADVSGLPSQARGLTTPDGPAAAIVTIGGNDLLGGLVFDKGIGVAEFAEALAAFVETLPIRPIFLGNVYDPTGGDDRRNFLSLNPAVARAALARVNQAIAEVAGRFGARLIDIHAHFLKGDQSWFVSVIEPSLQGASEVRRAFLPGLLAKAREASAPGATGRE